ncbi:hypothetical protein C2R80_07815 [Helicobacter pylori]|nr:hypothetical protein C2R80_07815 [Helicobacter pylori]
MFSQIFKILGNYRVKSNAFLVKLGSHSELFCKSPTQLITLKLTAQTNYPFFRDKFRVKTPLTLFYSLNILVFPAF